MRYLVDSSVLLHSLLSRPRLNQRGLDALNDESSELYFSAASSWEMIIKVGIGKLILPERPAEFVAHAIHLMDLRPLLLTHLHTLAVAELPCHHRDPFDRMLIAQALEENLVLLTDDRIFGKYQVDQVFCGH